jgi:hypothetical protein
MAKPSGEGIAHSPDIRFLQGTDGRLYSGGHPFAERTQSHWQRGKLVGTIRLAKPSMMLVSPSAAHPSANDHREHILFRGVREYDKHGPMKEAA